MCAKLDYSCPTTVFCLDRDGVISESVYAKSHITVLLLCEHCQCLVVHHWSIICSLSSVVTVVWCALMQVCDNAETQAVGWSRVLVQDKTEKFASHETRKPTLDTICTISARPSWCWKDFVGLQYIFPMHLLLSSAACFIHAAYCYL